MPITATNLINFSKTVSRSGTCSLTLDIASGGVMGRLTAAIYDKANQLLLSGGVDSTLPPLTTQQGGHVSWGFTVPASANALSWGVVVFAPLPNANEYTAIVRLLDAMGIEVARSSFSGALGGFNDPEVLDGVFFTNSNA